MIIPILVASLFAFGDDSRELLLLTDSVHNSAFQIQTEKLDLAASQIRDYEIVVKTETVLDGPLHARFQIKEPFTAILIGKDGGEKWRRSRNFELSEIFSLIDKMPMRREEIRKREP